MDNRVIDYKAREKALDDLRCCGRNRGPHDYIPVKWVRDGEIEHVKEIMCRICFQRVNMKTLYENFSEAKI